MAATSQILESSLEHDRSSFSLSQTLTWVFRWIDAILSRTVCVSCNDRKVSQLDILHLHISQQGVKRWVGVDSKCDIDGWTNSSGSDSDQKRESQLNTLTFDPSYMVEIREENNSISKFYYRSLAEGQRARGQRGHVRKRSPRWQLLGVRQKNRSTLCLNFSSTTAANNAQFSRFRRPSRLHCLFGAKINEKCQLCLPDPSFLENWAGCTSSWN